MAANNLVVDTNIFIEYLRAKNKLKTSLFLLPDSANLFVSVITVYELYMGATTIEKQNDVRTLIEDITILPFNQDAAMQSALIYHDLKKRNQIIEFRDVFIAATCILYNFPLKTINKGHFERIGEVVLV